MNAEQYLNVALGGNMNIGTLKLLAWHEIMEGYARHKLAEAHPQADNSAMDTICPECRRQLLFSQRQGITCIVCRNELPGKQHQ